MHGIVVKSLFYRAAYLFHSLTKLSKVASSWTFLIFISSYAFQTRTNIEDFYQ